MGIAIAQVDAFADRPFTGNPAGVCVLDAPTDAGWMQNVALEMNLAETAFLHPEADGYRLRWFTPTVEVDLCGHATLASAHILWEAGHLPMGTTARFHTRSGLLTARQAGDLIELDFPAEPAIEVKEETQAGDSAPEILAKALGVRGTFVGKNRFDYLVEVESEAAVHGLNPDMRALASLPVRGVIVTSRAATGAFDFVSRFFAPATGVPEDPATGSSHCCLGPYWQARLGKSALIGYQASARGGIVRVRVETEGNRAGRVALGGHAITVLRGELADVASP